MARRKRRDSMAPLRRRQQPQLRAQVVGNQAATTAFNADAEAAELDVVIPVYGRADLLQQCLIGLEASCIDVDYRLYVIDDASPNPSEMAVLYNSLPSNARLQRQTQNRGFPFTANHGVSLGASRSVLLLNSDVVLSAGAVRALLDMLWTSEPPVSKLDADPKAAVGAVGPKLIFPEDSSEPTRPAGKIQHAGMYFSLSGDPRHSYIGWAADTPRANVPTSVQCVTGACLMTRREVWQAIHQNYQEMGDTATNGALNVVYGRGTFEDIEYCIAVRSLGFKVAYQPLAVGSHLVGCSIMQDEQGYPLRQNSNIFKARAGHMIEWDHYRHC